MPSLANLSSMLTLAERLSVEAGRIARARLGTVQPRRKADDSEVTDVDIAIETLILEALSELHPNHAVLCEENMVVGRHGELATAEFCWVIDPLDGTRNFVRQFPVYATSIAVLQAGSPVVGVVHSHTTNQTFSVVAGGPASLDGRTVQVASQPLGRDTIIAIPSGRQMPAAPVVKDWIDRWVLRNLGSTALHMALVASGALDAALCEECKLWDVAAGALLVEAAGGVCTDFAGRRLFPRVLTEYANNNVPFLCAGAAVHEELLRCVQEKLSAR